MEYLPYMAAAVSIVWSLTQFWLNWHRIQRKMNFATLPNYFKSTLDIAALLSMAALLWLFGQSVNRHLQIGMTLFGSLSFAAGSMFVNIVYGNLKKDVTIVQRIAVYFIPVLFMLIGLVSMYLGLFVPQ